MGDLKHYGTPRHSGRYPWGSGADGYQRNKTFLSQVDELRRQGLSEVEIAEGMGMTTSELRSRKSIARTEKRAADAAQALRLKEKGYSNVAIGKRMGINESSVRSLLDPALKTRSALSSATAEILAESVLKKKYIDIGAGVEAHLGISRTKLDTAVAILEEQGYTVHKIGVEQLGTGKYTIMKVLAAPDTPYSEVYKNRSQIRTVTDWSDDGGESWNGLKPVVSVDGSRVQVRYKEDGGAEKDGLIELRRGVGDISLGNARYAQVRIAMDGTHYMKGMAVYADNMPEGVDIIYNSNKARGSDKDTVFKKLKDDPYNPFGSLYRQRYYKDENGEDQLSALNIVNEEGKWGEWSKSISSQVLSKQSPALAKKQLGLAFDMKVEEFDEIASLTNPAVKKSLLNSFADDCDSSAIHLKAAALPRQAAHVILPFTSIKPNEIYAPMYENGENVVLIRHPHGGIFEIPELVVNNKNPEARRIIPNATDAVGIHPKVAEKLSGADFDGDTVLVIPNPRREIRTAPSLKGLEGFNPREAYPGYEGMTVMTPRTKQLKMGDVSNLITDMTIKGANEDELARAVRHSMVVIDAEKHKLNYKLSYVENGIGELKKKYQGGDRAGSSTLISRSSSELRVPHRKDRITIDPETGKKVYKYSGETYTKQVPDRNGPWFRDPNTGKRVYTQTVAKVVPRTTLTTKMAEAEDANTLSSGTRMEAIYAEYANNLKALGNRARKMIVETEDIPYSPTAKQTYAKEVASLTAKLNLANRNKPLERQAQLVANKIVALKKQDNPNMDPADLKKIKGQALQEARNRTGAKKQKIEITDREWEAIQLGAISTNKLSEILLNADLDEIKQRAMPRGSVAMSPAKLARARNMLSSGYTQAEVASALGISASTLMKSLQ